MTKALAGAEVWPRVGQKPAATAQVACRSLEWTLSQSTHGREMRHSMARTLAGETHVTDGRRGCGCMGGPQEHDRSIPCPCA